jgi:integrase
MKWKCYKKIFGDTWIRKLRADTNLLVSDTRIPGLHLRYYAGTGKVVFYLGYMVRHTHTRRNLLLGQYGVFTLTEIRKRALDFKKTITDGADPIMDSRAAQTQLAAENAKRVRVGELLDAYYEKHSRVYKKPLSQKTDAGLISRMKPYLGDLFITELSLPILIDFYKTMTDKSSFGTANHYIALISNFWNWCETYEYLPMNSNPCRKIPKGKNKKITIRPLSLDEYKKLLNALDDGFTQSPYHPRMFRALKVLMLTGCRTTEITKLKKTDVDLDTGFIYLRESKNNEEKHPIGKPAADELRLALAESPKHSDMVFPATRGNAGAVLDIRKAHEWAVARAGLPKMRKHDFRHSFVSIGTDTLGMPIQAVSKAIGHADIATTAIYSHTSDKTRLDTANRIATAIVG